MVEAKVQLGICTMTVLFLTSIILFAVSFDTLDPHQVGIKYNNNLVTIDKSRVYSNGRYFLGLGLSFIKYPLNIQQELYYNPPLDAWTQEGQLVTLDITFMYRLDRDHIVDIYEKYTTNWGVRFKQIATRIIKRVTVQYTALQFFTDRRLIEEHMRADVRARLAEEYVNLDIFSLRQIDVPDAFDAKILQKVVTAQQENTAEQIKETEVLRAAIGVLQGGGYAQANLTIYLAAAQQLLTVEAARSDVIAMIAQQEASSYAYVQQQLGLNATSVLKYRYNQLMIQLDQDVGQARSYLIGLQSSLYGVNF